MRERDPNAVMIAVEKYGLPRCLHIPIAARDIASIERFIGNVMPIFHQDSAMRAVQVAVDAPEEMDERLIVWDMANASLLHRTPQVWVHVDYRGYRQAYQKVHPDEDVSHLVLDHVLNRRVARLTGFPYVRLVPITRAANSSSGGLSEKMELDFQSWPSTVAWHAAHPRSIQYADVGALAKMLDLTVGNSLHENVNEFQRRLREQRRG